MMTKQELFEFFNRKAAKSMLKVGYDGVQIVGKRCQIQVLDDGTIDLWMVAADKGGERARELLGCYWLGLRERSLDEAGLSAHRLEGEMWVQGGDDLKKWIFAHFKVLGIRRYSEAMAKRASGVFRKTTTEGSFEVKAA